MSSARSKAESAINAAMSSVFADTTHVFNPGSPRCNAFAVHDWRNHLPDCINEHWDSLTEFERKIVILTAELSADKEEWE